MAKSKYKCSDCGLEGHKLWRDYGYADELWCAVCCDRKIAAAEKKRPSDPWDEPNGPLNKMVYGFSGVPAIPSHPDNFDIFQSSGAYKTEQLLWWQALPTYEDERTEIQTIVYTMRESWDRLRDRHLQIVGQIKKVNALRARLRLPELGIPENPTANGYGYSRTIESAREVMLSHLRKLYDAQGRSLELYREMGNLEWRLDRLVIEITKPVAVTVLGSKTEKHGEYYITGPEEQKRTLQPGERIAIGRTNSAVVITDNEFVKSPSILDYEQDGDMLVQKFVGGGVSKVVDGRY